jgi:ribosomal protein L11 methyltransferase
MKKWFAADVTVLPSASEAVESALGLVGAIGTASDSLKKGPDEPVVVTGFFEEPVSLEDVEDAIDNEFEITGHDRDCVSKIDFRLVEEEDWLAEWKKHWQPTDVGRFIIAPPWSSVPETKDIFLIRIEPNMAFGTGTHETTQLCLEALDEIITPGMTVIDVGTGTGILAIAAAKLGVRHIRAYDTDADSVNIAATNAQANGVADVINFFEDTIDKTTKEADLVIANLTLDVIVPLLPILVEKADIWLLLSGILATQESGIRDELAKFETSDLQVKQKGEWISVLVGT